MRTTTLMRNSKTTGQLSVGTAVARAALYMAVLISSELKDCRQAVGEEWSTRRNDDANSLELIFKDQRFATYSFNDPEIPRPYFANVTAPGGVQITRNHPPAEGDFLDHEKIHPGVWMAFGDLSGADNWRLAAPVEHVRFIAEPREQNGVLSFSVENRYLDSAGDEEVCRQLCRFEFHPDQHGVLLLWDSHFFSEHGEFYFGDQEELGLGVRLATPIAVKSGQGGRILNSEGLRNEEEAWGKQARWCDYSGIKDGRFVGITIMPHPENFRASWCHCRNTGFMAMNPFGRNAFTGGEKSRVMVPRGERFPLRYGVLFHWHEAPGDFDPSTAYERYLRLAK